MLAAQGQVLLPLLPAGVWGTGGAVMLSCGELRQDQPTPSLSHASPGPRGRAGGAGTVRAETPCLKSSG